MTRIASAPAGSTVATAEPDDATAQTPAEPGPGWHDGTEASVLERLSTLDLPPSLRQLAYPGTGRVGGVRAVVAQYAPPSPHRADAGAALFGTQQVNNGAATQQSAPAQPVVPGPPMKLAQLQTLNNTVQHFNVKRSPIPEAELRATQRHFQDATDALRKGDYKAAEAALGQLGFPLPAPGNGQQPSTQAAITCRMLGVPARSDGAGGWQIDGIRYGAHGNQAVNDPNGFAANAHMLNRMASLPGGVSNPPTEAQAMQYMRDFGQPAHGKPPSTQEVMQAASEITDGTIVHYSSAGARDPQYGANPSPHAVYRDRQGQIHEFDSLADARAAAQAGHPPIQHGGQITTLTARAPDAWSDISSQGTRAGRNIGDCENKLYLQTRLLTEAGFTSVGSVDVRPPGGDIGHMFGVFRAQDGSTWVTSNEQYRQVQGSGPHGEVTQADLDTTLRDMTAEVYHVQPDRNGVRDTSRFAFTSAATAQLNGTSTATDSIRRVTELGMMGRSDTLIPPPKPQP